MCLPRAPATVPSRQERRLEGYPQVPRGARGLESVGTSATQERIRCSAQAAGAGERERARVRSPRGRRTRKQHFRRVLLSLPLRRPLLRAARRSSQARQRTASDLRRLHARHPRRDVARINAIHIREMTLFTASGITTVSRCSCT